MKKGFTITETLVTIVIVTFLIAALFVLSVSSDRNWQVGQNKLIEQQEARRAMDNIVKPLRESSPSWVDKVGNAYPTQISEGGKKIDFYIISSFYPDCCPSNCSVSSDCLDSNGKLHNAGDIKSLSKVTVNLNPDNSRQLLKKIGASTPVAIGNEIENINFGGGCAGCSEFSCSTVANNCPVVKIEVKTKKNAEFTLKSQVTLRNQNITLPEGVEIKQ